MPKIFNSFVYMHEYSQKPYTLITIHAYTLVKPPSYKYVLQWNYFDIFVDIKSMVIESLITVSHAHMHSLKGY